MDPKLADATGEFTPLLVACLCAQWCGTCRDYQPLFKQFEAQFPGIRFVWIDVEDQADLVDPIEVENFPTLLIARDGQPVFFGTITPHLETLRRLVLQYADDINAKTLDDTNIAGLSRRLAL